MVSASSNARSVSAATARRGKPVTRTRTTRSAREREDDGADDSGMVTAAAVTRAFCGDRLRTSSLRSSNFRELARAELEIPHQRDRDDGRGLDPQDAGTEPDRVEAGVPRRLHLGGGEATFGADEQRRRLAAVGSRPQRGPAPPPRTPSGAGAAARAPTAPSRARSGRRRPGHRPARTGGPPPARSSPSARGASRPDERPNAPSTRGRCATRPARRSSAPAGPCARRAAPP